MSDPRDASAYSVLFAFIRALIDQTEELLIQATVTEEGATFTVHVHTDDLGKVIGKQGRTARALRTLLGAMGTKLGRHYSLNIEYRAPSQRNAA
jgi:predicted RNA-binding protein YlqC (UPF0109 family)